MSNNEKRKGWYPSEEKILGRDYCSKHKISYPYGSTCPKCDEEEKKD